MNELPSQTDWMTRTSRALVQIGLVPALALVTLALVPVFTLLAPLIVWALGRGNPIVAAQVAALSALILVPAVGALVLRLLFQLERARARLSVLATQDSLTGVHNRRYFFEVAEREWSRCKRYGEDAALLLIDADNFKAINDVYGHLCGDRLLVAIAKAVRATLRQPDLMARFGGEELVILLPHTDPLGALDVAERIRERAEQLEVPWQDQRLRITVSTGVATVRPAHAQLSALMQDAESALEASRQAGGNSVRAAPVDLSRPASSGVGDNQAAGPL